VDFALSDEQKMLEGALGRLLADRLPMPRLRAIAAAGGHDPELADGLAAQGIDGLLVPARFGGSGLAILDAAVAAEHLGYHAVPAAFAASFVMAPLALQASGSEAQQREWLPRIAAGQMRVALGFATAIGQTGIAEIAYAADNRLSGRVQTVLDGAGATHILIYLADGRPALVALGAEGVQAKMVASLDATRPLLDVSFARTPAVVLAAANQPETALTRVLNAGRLMLAADTLGAAQSMLDKAVAFAKQRTQFGRIIGSFQAVKHTLADLATSLEPCRALVWYAAHAQDALPEEARIAALHAKAHLDEVGREVARLTTEVHGGMGFTDLLGLHYWYKRIAANRQLLGTPERCRHEAAQLQGWTAG
jgi:alkylation response protein AidB-like acyl-CoA dehydrogenase